MSAGQRAATEGKLLFHFLARLSLSVYLILSSRDLCTLARSYSGEGHIFQFLRGRLGSYQGTHSEVGVWGNICLAQGCNEDVFAINLPLISLIIRLLRVM